MKGKGKDTRSGDEGKVVGGEGGGEVGGERGGERGGEGQRDASTSGKQNNDQTTRELKDPTPDNDINMQMKDNPDKNEVSLYIVN